MTRNRFTGQIKDVQVSSAIDRILVQVGEFEIESLMTHQDSEKLHLQPGDSVTVVIKPTDVALQRPRSRVVPAKAGKAAHAG